MPFGGVFYFKITLHFIDSDITIIQSMHF